MKSSKTRLSTTSEIYKRCPYVFDYGPALQNPQFSNQNPASVMISKTEMNKSFEELKQIDAGVLNVGYAEAGLADGPVVILFHGWPYDIHSFVDVTPLLVSAWLKAK